MRAKIVNCLNVHGRLPGVMLYSVPRRIMCGRYKLYVRGDAID